MGRRHENVVMGGTSCRRLYAQARCRQSRSQDRRGRQGLHSRRGVPKGVRSHERPRGPHRCSPSCDTSKPRMASLLLRADKTDSSDAMQTRKPPMGRSSRPYAVRNRKWCRDRSPADSDRCMVCEPFTGSPQHPHPPRGPEPLFGKVTHGPEEHCVIAGDALRSPGVKGCPQPAVTSLQTLLSIDFQTPLAKS